MYKQKVITKSIKDKNISEMFNQMLGAGSINLNMCYPKYHNIKNYSLKIIDILDMFNNSPFLKNFEDLEVCRNDISYFITISRQEWKEIFDIDLSDYEWNLNIIDDDIKKDFEEKYERMKKSQLIHTIIKMCDNLIPYRRYIYDVNNLDYKFMIRMAGSEFCPFPFTNLNFKYMIDVLLSNGERKKEIEFLMVVLSKILSLSYNMYREYNSPDFDVDEFAYVIIDNIKEARKRVPRCDKAFKKIEESVDLLKGNFTDYYRDFVQSQDQSIIIQNFVVDVAKNTKADPEITRQFRQIIMHFRKMANNHINNPKVRILFDKVNENFTRLEQYENLVKVKSLDDDNDDENNDKDHENSKSCEDQATSDISNEITNETVDDEEESRVEEINDPRDINELVSSIEGNDLTSSKTVSNKRKKRRKKRK